MRRERGRLPLRCRVFGHNVGRFGIREGWLVIEHPCSRCGWQPRPHKETE